MALQAMERSSLAGKRVFVAGHRGMVGASLVRRLHREGCEILTVTREDLDLRRQRDVEAWMAEHRPDIVVVAAARVGGILANSSYPADFIYDNLMIEANLIHAAYAVGVDKLLFLGSSCVYPRDTTTPIQESSLLSGPLEPTNEWYAVAKIAGIKLCEAYRRQHGCDFITAMPCNLYGPGDNFHPTGSHVIPGLIRRFQSAMESRAGTVECWGSGSPRREFLHVDDLADACVVLLNGYSGAEPVNVGAGADMTIAELAQRVKLATGYRGSITWDVLKPDGTPQKLMDSSRIAALGWRPAVPFEEGLRQAVDWYRQLHVTA